MIIQRSLAIFHLDKAGLRLKRGRGSGLNGRHEYGDECRYDKPWKMNVQLTWSRYNVTKSSLMVEGGEIDGRKNKCS